MTSRQRPTYPGGPKGSSNSGPSRLRGGEEREALKRRDSRHRAQRRRRRNVVAVTALAGVAAGVGGYLLGLVGQDVEDRIRAPETGITSEEAIERQVDRVLMELWLMEIDEIPTGPRR